MAEERVGKVQFSELHRPRDLHLDLGLGHTAYRRASVIDLYPHTKVNFFVDGLTVGTPPSSRSRDTKSRKNSKNPAGSNFDIML